MTGFYSSVSPRQNRWSSAASSSSSSSSSTSSTSSSSSSTSSTSSTSSLSSSPSSSFPYSPTYDRQKSFELKLPPPSIMAYLPPSPIHGSIGAVVNTLHELFSKVRIEKYIPSAAVWWSVLDSEISSRQRSLIHKIDQIAIKIRGETEKLDLVALVNVIAAKQLSEFWKLQCLGEHDLKSVFDLLSTSTLSVYYQFDLIHIFILVLLNENRIQNSLPLAAKELSKMSDVYDYHQNTMFHPELNPLILLCETILFDSLMKGRETGRFDYFDDAAGFVRDISNPTLKSEASQFLKLHSELFGFSYIPSESGLPSPSQTRGSSSTSSVSTTSIELPSTIRPIEISFSDFIAKLYQSKKVVYIEEWQNALKREIVKRHADVLEKGTGDLADEATTALIRLTDFWYWKSRGINPEQLTFDIVTISSLTHAKQCSILELFVLIILFQNEIKDPPENFAASISALATKIVNVEDVNFQSSRTYFINNSMPLSFLCKVFLFDCLIKDHFNRGVCFITNLSFTPLKIGAADFFAEMASRVYEIKPETFESYKDHVLKDFLYYRSCLSALSCGNKSDAEKHIKGIKNGVLIKDLLMHIGFN